MTSGEIHKSFIDRAVGISIIHLRSVFVKDRILVPHSPMDYHLHTLIMYDVESKSGSVLCLDTGDLQTFPCPELHLLRDTSRESILQLARTFVDRVAAVMESDQFEADILFDRMSQPLWDKFNMIKEHSFLQSLAKNREKKPRLTDTPISGFLKDYLDTPAEQYGWAKIWLAEERIIDQPDTVAI